MQLLWPPASGGGGQEQFREQEDLLLCHISFWKLFGAIWASCRGRLQVLQLGHCRVLQLVLAPGCRSGTRRILQAQKSAPALCDILRFANRRCARVDLGCLWPRTGLRRRVAQDACVLDLCGLAKLRELEIGYGERGLVQVACLVAAWHFTTREGRVPEWGEGLLEQVPGGRSVYLLSSVRLIETLLWTRRMMSYLVTL